MKHYSVSFDELQDKGLFAVSLVENPAMEDLWITLKDHPKEIQLAAVDQEKRLLLGAALIPDKKIYRNINGEEFYITFPKETIEACGHAFIENGYQNNSTLEHQAELTGMSVVESWIVADTQKDKSAAFGKEYPVGTLVFMMKAKNDQMWKDAKEGKIKGFSIEGLFSLKELELKNHIQMNKQSIIDAVKEAMGLNKQEVKMGQLKLKDAKTKIEFEGDAPEKDRPVFLLTDEGEKIPMPEGEHELEGGEILHIDKNGLVTDAPVEEEVVEQKVDKEELIAAVAHVMGEKMKEFEVKLEAKLSEMKSGYEAKLADAKKENADLEKKLEATPAEAKIVKTDLSFEEPKTPKERIFNTLLQAKN